MGSEAQTEFGERSAPAERVQLVQGTSLVALAQKTDHEVVYIPPAAATACSCPVWQSSIGSYIHHHDNWFKSPEGVRFLYLTEAGGQSDTIRDDAQIYEELLGQLWAEWDHIKNGPHREDARNWDLLWVSPKAGKRESRRLLGDVIDANDPRRLAVFQTISPMVGTTWMTTSRSTRAATSTAIAFPHVQHPIPDLLPRNVPNLFLAGRLISATHLAHSSTRLMRTGGAIGQAVGYAAACAVATAASHAPSTSNISTSCRKGCWRQMRPSSPGRWLGQLTWPARQPRTQAAKCASTSRHRASSCRCWPRPASCCGIGRRSSVKWRSTCITRRAVHNL